MFPPDHIAETRPDYVLILPWNLRDEIIESVEFHPGVVGPICRPDPEPGGDMRRRHDELGSRPAGTMIASKSARREISSPMKVVIFCGGLGLRLRDHSVAVPKPLVSIGDAPILLHQMRYYAHYGHRDFILCLGYKGDIDQGLLPQSQ